MSPSMASTSRNDRPRRVNLGVEPAHLADAEPLARARMLRELAAWYQAFAGRAANPAIWESRLLTAADLIADASRIDPQQVVSEQSFRRKETSDEASRE
jgi:hypothetical protein